jgi:hypothetical protein
MHKQKVDVWVPWTPLPAISVCCGWVRFPVMSMLWMGALPRDQRLVVVVGILIVGYKPHIHE